MSWFEEQLEYRQKIDDSNFEYSLNAIASSVMGRDTSNTIDNRRLARDAMEEILKYYHCKAMSDEIPSAYKTMEEQLEFVMSPLGIMRRNVELEKNWYKQSTGPMLGTLKEDGRIVALLPAGVQGYSYYDINSGKRVKINRSTADRISSQAICFYQPFPLKPLNLRDIMVFIMRQYSFWDKCFVLLFIGFTTILGMLSPVLVEILFRDVINSGSMRVLLAIMCFLVCHGMATQIFSIFQKLLTARVNIKVGMAIESAVMSRILALPSSFFKEYSAGELSQRSSYVEELCQNVLELFSGTILPFVFSLVYIGQIFAFAPSLVAPAFFVTFSSFFINAIVTAVQIKITRQKMLINSKQSGLSYSTITGIQKIKLAGAEKRMFARWAKLYAKESELEYNPPKLLVLNPTINMAISSLGLILIYFVAFYNNVGVSEYYAFNASYGMISAAFTALAGGVTMLADIKPTLEMARPILETMPEVAEEKERIVNLKGGIELADVSFRYSEDMPNVIEHLSLKIKPGEYVAIVGSTGCGKSTLIRLLLGFETPQKGSIYYDRKDIRKLDLKTLRKKIGVVMQNGKLFQDDIFSNIVISAPELTLQDAWEAARLAAVDEDISRMPMGMNTIICDGQGGISGGQKQRLMIARALAPKPRIVILDEATSALDNITQKQISDAIDSLNCTRIVVAHRLSTIRHADRILYLDRGRIVEEGTYEQLIEKNGYFAELVERQRLDIDID